MSAKEEPHTYDVGQKVASGAKRVEHCPDIILIVFLGHHANEKFPLISVLCVRWFHLYGVMHLKSSRKTVVAEWGLGDL